MWNRGPYVWPRLLEISKSTAMQGTICVNSLASSSGQEMACQQRGGDCLSCAERTMAKGIKHYSKILRREANDGPTTRHIVVEETAGVIHMVISEV
jgi:hypothetical protein